MGGHHEINWMQNREEKSPEQVHCSHGRILWICKEITSSGAIMALNPWKQNQNGLPYIFDMSDNADTMSGADGE